MCISGRPVLTGSSEGNSAPSDRGREFLAASSSSRTGRVREADSQPRRAMVKIAVAFIMRFRNNRGFLQRRKVSASIEGKGS